MPVKHTSVRFSLKVPQHSLSRHWDSPHHYFIYKDNEGTRTQSHIRVLNTEERVTEIAKMLSNDKVTPEALRAAEVLLK